jgi:hypothetical protein
LGVAEHKVLLSAYRFIRWLELPALFLGGIGAALGHRWGAYVLLAGLVVQIGARLIVGTTAYRDVMARPWPKVAPLDDDPWDD